MPDREAVNLSQLGQHDKRRVWTHLQRSQPALAELLCDPALRELAEAFDADVMLDRGALDGLD